MRRCPCRGHPDQLHNMVDNDWRPALVRRILGCYCNGRRSIGDFGGERGMIGLQKLGVAFTALLFTLFVNVAPASAQATRTWVSGVGDDANPCSRTAPCKTFAGAISKTAAGGEINCLDPGGFGGVTITKSISIICDHTEGGVLVSGTNAIV